MGLGVRGFSASPLGFALGGFFSFSLVVFALDGLFLGSGKVCSKIILLEQSAGGQVWVVGLPVGSGLLAVCGMGEDMVPLLL